MKRKDRKRLSNQPIFLLTLPALAYISSLVLRNLSYGQNDVRQYVLGLNPQWYHHDESIKISSATILHSLPIDGTMTCLEDAPDIPTCTFTNTNTCWTPKMPTRFFSGNVAIEGYIRVIRPYHYYLKYK
jgi:hypothetical protein